LAHGFSDECLTVLHKISASPHVYMPCTLPCQITRNKNCKKNSTCFQ